MRGAIYQPRFMSVLRQHGTTRTKDPYTLCCIGYWKYVHACMHGMSAWDELAYLISPTKRGFECIGIDSTHTHVTYGGRRRVVVTPSAGGGSGHIWFSFTHALTSLCLPP